MKINHLFLLSILSLFSCNSSTKEEPNINKGTITIAVDESIMPIIEAQINAHHIHYPGTKIITKYLPETKGINMLLDDSVTMACTTREFNESELGELQRRGIKYLPARMALDAVALVQNKENKDTTITLDELKILLTDKGSKTKLVFDRSNSSNLNVIMEKLKLKTINTENVYSADGNLQVIDFVKKSPNAIGFIGFNWISDTDDKKAQDLLDEISLIAVGESDQKGYFKTNFKNLDKRKYPLERFVYLHTLTKAWGVENGFIRFACSKTGQLVTEKMGLVPFYIIPKEFLLDTKPMKK
ncbi:MAG: substrate-binding domain-containing protein [Leadbetterella sp.]|nr:substrate-binding domain-containing protein [Leadbetterella sp.]MBP8155513.1 substrate-binding domain-containing protein [Leadbetterella sp.]